VTPPESPPGPGWVPASPPQMTWYPPPPPVKRSRRTLWIVLGVVTLVLLLVIWSCSQFIGQLGNSFGPGFAVINASNGQITNFNVNTFNGRTTVYFTAARGLDLPDGPRLACDVVGPAIEGTTLAGAEWVILNRAGDVIASSDTPCP
jgi:hypothetical protein